MKFSISLIFFIAIHLKFYAQSFSKLESVREIYPYDTITYLNSKIDLTNNKIDVRKDLVANSFLPEKFPRRDFKKDSNGVKLSNGNKYKPTAIMGLAMSSYHEYKVTKGKEPKLIFLDQVQWLKNNFYTYKSNYGYWLFPDKSRANYKLKPYWNSALTQGFGIDVCFLAYDITKDPIFLKMAKLAFKGYMIPISYGGFQRKIKGYNWYEEYPTTEPSMVLNGYVFSLAGLKNFYDNTGNGFAKKMFDDGVKSLENFLPAYDLEFSSKYMLMTGDLYIAKKTYHKLHIEQLLWLYYLTEKEIFYNYAKKFLEVRKSNFRVANKNIERIKNITKSQGDNIESLQNNKWWGKYYEVNDESTILNISLSEKKPVYGVALYYSENDFFCKENIDFRLNNNSIDFEIVNQSTKKLRQNQIDITTYRFINAKKDNYNKLMLTFNRTLNTFPIELFEVYVFIDMTKEVNDILSKIKKSEQKLKKLSSY